MASPAAYDRNADALGTIVALEHVNTTVPDQRLATLFYVAGLGLTRDPYLMVDDENMWVNVGRQQFHLPTRGTQVLRGHVGLVIPDLDALDARLARVASKLAGTQFTWTRDERSVTAVSPWGNLIRCYAPQPCFGRMTLGMPYVAFDVPPGAAAGIQRFYQAAYGVAGRLSADGRTRASRWARTRKCCSARARRRSLPTIAITSQSTCPTSRARMRGCSPAVS